MSCFTALKLLDKIGINTSQQGWLIYEIGDFTFDDDLTVYKGL